MQKFSETFQGKFGVLSKISGKIDACIENMEYTTLLKLGISHPHHCHLNDYFDECGLKIRFADQVGRPVEVGEKINGGVVVATLPFPGGWTRDNRSIPPRCKFIYQI